MTAKVERPVTPASQSRLSSQQAAAKVITSAFQPIFDTRSRKTVSYEALVRTPEKESAAQIFEQIAPGDLNAFDQRCRVTAIKLAVDLKIPCNLNLNILANSKFSSERRIRSTVEAAHLGGLPLDCIVLEVAEGQIIQDRSEFAKMIDLYRGMGFKMAIDDFGAGYSGLNLLADFQPDQIKVDRSLITNIQSRGPRQVIVRAIVQVCHDLGIDLVAEGIETEEEYSWLASEGVYLFQGYFFGHPAFEALKEARCPKGLPAPVMPS